MESASLVTLVTPEDAVHETLHHWWGNGVQIQSWGDFWISEGLTTYFTGFFDEITTGINTSCSLAGRALDVSPEQDPLDNFDADPYCIGAAAIADFRSLLAEASGLQASDPEAVRQFLEVFSRIYEERQFTAIDTRTLIHELKTSAFQVLCQSGDTMSYRSVDGGIDAWAERWFSGIPRPEASRRRPSRAPAPRCENYATMRTIPLALNQH
jgi:hypothetical protein